jgi:hypothetical protein
MHRRKIGEGNCLTGYELEKNGRSTVEKFIKGLDKRKQAGILALLKWIADNGKPRDPRKFISEEECIFAVKDFQVRVYCFLGEDNSIILTNGAIKKDNRAKPEDLRKAKRLRDEYERRMT